MVHVQLEGDAGQRTNPGGIAVDEGFGVKLGTIGTWRTQDDEKIFFAVFVNRFNDLFLTFQVKCSRRGSDKTLCLDKQGFSPRTFDAGLDGRPLNTVSFTNNDDFFFMEI